MARISPRNLVSTAHPVPILSISTDGEPLSPSANEYLQSLISGSSTSTTLVEDRDEFDDLPERGRPPIHKTVNGALYRSLNRYPDVLPFDSNRVILRNKRYINASAVQIGDVRSILGQAPIPSSMTDFWVMAMENNVGTIICLGEVDGERIEKYWSKNTIFRVLILEPENSSPGDGALRSESFRELTLRRISKKILTEEKDVIVRKFELAYIDDPLKCLTLRHICLSSWADQSPPCEKFGIAFDCFSKYTSNFSNPSIIHCSAGIGRSGTFFAAAVIRRHPERNLTDIITDLRLQRAGCVQTPEQFAFLKKLVRG